MKNYICDGERIVVVASAAVNSGDLIFVGQKAAVAVTSAAIGATFSAQTEGVFELTKATGAINQGDLLYYSVANKNLTTTAVANIFVGYAYKSALSADTTVQCSIVDNPDSNPVGPAANQAASIASDAAGLKTDFNALLSKLKAAGLMAHDA